MPFSIFCTKIIKIHWKRFCSKFIRECIYKKIINLIDVLYVSMPVLQFLTIFLVLNG